MSLNSDEASLPGGVVSLPSREFFPLPRLGISATLPEEIVTASFEEVALQDNVDFLKTHPTTSVSKSMTRLK